MHQQLENSSGPLSADALDILTRVYMGAGAVEDARQVAGLAAAGDTTQNSQTRKKLLLLRARDATRMLCTRLAACHPVHVSEWHGAAHALSLTRDVWVAAALVKAYTAAQNWKGVDRVWTELRESGTVPDRPLFNAFIKAYSTAQDVDKLKAVLSEMEAAGMPMDKYTHLPVLLAALHGKDKELVSLLPHRSTVLCGRGPDHWIALAAPVMWGPHAQRVPEAQSPYSPNTRAPPPLPLLPIDGPK